MQKIPETDGISGNFFGVLRAHLAVFKAGKSMIVGVQALFTSALRLLLLLAVVDLKLDTAKRRLNLKIDCPGTA